MLKKRGARINALYFKLLCSYFNVKREKNDTNEKERKYVVEE